MLPHSPSDVIIDVEQFSITITFRITSFNVFTVAWPNETVLQSKLCSPLLCSSGFLLWAGHMGISLPLPSFQAGNDLLNSLVKHRSDTPRRQSGDFRVQLWAGQFLVLCETQHYIVAFWTDPNSGQSSLLFSALNSFIHCLFLLPGTIRLVWLGFA